MYRIIDFCCICFNNKENLQHLCTSDSYNITYFIKLTSSVPEMYFNEMSDQWLVCITCCEAMDAVFKFRQRCLRSKNALLDYISLNKISNIGSTVNVYLTDIKKYDIELFQSDNNLQIKIETSELLKNVNEINDIENSKSEKSPVNLKLKDTKDSNIEFENVLIKVEPQNFDGYVEENCNFYCPLENQEDIKIDIIENDIKESVNSGNQCNDEYIQTNFHNILKTNERKNDNFKSNNEENQAYSYLGQYSDDQQNPNQIKNEYVNNDEMNIQSNSGNIDCLTNEDYDISLKFQDETHTAEGSSPCFNEFSSERSKYRDIAIGHIDPEDKKNQMKTPSIEKKHECSICSKKFMYPYLLAAHIRSHTGEKTYECCICNRKFSVSGNLSAHMKIHDGRKPHECSVCKKAFTQTCGLIKHMRIHTGEKPYECSVCGKRFNVSHSLTIHLRTHTGERPHQCSVCKKTFVTSSSLVIHMRIHTGEKLHQCSVCMKKFSESSNLAQHMRIHTGEKPYECNICMKKFSHSSHLNRHLRTHTKKKK